MGMAAAGPGAARDRAGQIITAGLIGGVAFVARLSAEDFGPTAARILPSGAIRAP